MHDDSNAVGKGSLGGRHAQDRLYQRPRWVRPRGIGGRLRRPVESRGQRVLRAAARTGTAEAALPLQPLAARPQRLMREVGDVCRRDLPPCFPRPGGIKP